MKTAVFWVVEPCSLVEEYRRFRLILLPDYTAQQPRRQPLLFENRLLGRTYDPRSEEVTGGCRKLRNEEAYSSPYIIR
jgi:hypothetical protein